MSIYLDNCALGRLFDEQTQPRVGQEAAAAEQVLERVRSGVYRWISSPVLEFEIFANPDEVHRPKVLDQLNLATSIQDLNDAIRSHSTALRRQGLADFDALHLATAIYAGCGALLTTDDRFIRQSARTVNVRRAWS